VTPTRRPEVGLFIDPPNDRFFGDRLFAEHPYGDYNAPYDYVKQLLGQQGIPVHTADLVLSGEGAAERNLYVSIGQRARYRRLARRPDVVLSALVVHECPIADPALFSDLFDASLAFRRIYSFSGADALAPFVRGPVDVRPLRYPYPVSEVDQMAWERKGRAFLAMINANKIPPLKTSELYTERLRAVEHFSRHEEIDLFGFGWGGPPYRIGGSRLPRPLQRIRYQAERVLLQVGGERDPLLASARRAYRGSAISKSETLSRYTFSICFENMVLEGWVTEKIFDCLRVGTVPVYLGAPDIDSWVWPECFVDMRRFSGYDELREFLHTLSPAEIDAYRAAGREYFSSKQFYPFTKQAFSAIFEEIVREDAEVTS